jgi:outer membrane protein
MIGPPAFSQTAPSQTATPPAQTAAEQTAVYQPLPETPVVKSRNRFARNYSPSQIPSINLANSDRLDALMKGGNIYLSMNDTIALALENNLDIETQRISPAIADANILRAKSGGPLRGVTPSVQTGPQSATAATAGSGANVGISSSAASQASSVGNTSGALIQQTGSTIPNLDANIQGVLNFARSSTPQTSTFGTGTSSFVLNNDIGQIQYSQGFLTGTTFSAGYSDAYTKSNNLRSDFNPSRSGSLTINFTQHLLQGFGIAVNNRNIRIARNNREAADLQFKQQVIATVANVMDLYWDLVSFNDDVKSKQQSLAYNQKLYKDNRRQVEIGTMAPIEIVRAEAAVASSEQDLVLSQTRVLQQETIIKNVLSKNGVASPTLAEAHIIPTDRIRVPEEEAIEPYQDMVAQALRARPEVSSQRINIVNADINLKGSRSQLLPTLDAFGSIGNNALVGTPNPLESNIPGFTSVANPYFVGGYGTLFGQLFGHNFPNYSAGVQLNIPLKNRAAQADYVLDQYTKRQQELSLQKLENQVRVDVQNAIIGLAQARAVYKSAIKARILQEQTLDAEQKKLELGASTIFQTILVQRDLANAQSAEVSALANYSKARVEIDRATGRLLANNNISLDEAFRGRVSRAPSPLPQ